MYREAAEAIQSETLAIWRGHVGEHQTVALLDFPSYQNAGDTLIYRGEQSYLRKLGTRVAYLADHARYNPDDLKRRLPEGPILLRGGGNLGDRWRTIQDFRERVISDFPDRRIVQLPQSVDFNDDQRTRQAQSIFRSHPNLTLMLRDSVSLDRARTLFPTNETVFSPDGAFGVGAQGGGVWGGTYPIVKVLRRDAERKDIGLSALPGIETDWGFDGAAEAMWSVSRIPQRVSRKAPRLGRALYPSVLGGYEAQARMNDRQARVALQKGSIVVTDRLHAAVLGALMGKPVIVADNSYGKVSAVYDDYLHRFSGVKLVHTFAEASKHLESFTAA